MSPEIGTKVVEGGDDIQLGVSYEIVDVEEITTEIGLWKGIRVQLMSKKAEEGNVMLWRRPITSPRSKLGALIELLGSNTDKWLHKWIIFKSWQQGARIVELTK